MKKFLFFIAIYCCHISFLQSEENKIVVNNVVLARIHGKTITLLDAVKKMDLVMMRFYPETFASSKERCTFYKSQWKSMVVELINQELIVQAAEVLQIPVSQGDVRQELEEMFGPQVMINIERAGLTYSEAWDMVKTDIIIRRMMHWQIASHVQTEVRPDDIRKSYDEYLTDGKSRAQYSYRMSTFKGDEVAKLEPIAKEAYELIASGKNLSDLEGILKDKLEAQKITLSISDLIEQDAEEMAETVLATVGNLEEGKASAPQVQRGRVSGVPCMRMYVLEKKNISPPKSFEEMSENLRQTIMEERYAQQSAGYFSKLRKDFNVDIDSIFAALPANFAPFSMSDGSESAQQMTCKN